MKTSMYITVIISLLSLSEVSASKLCGGEDSVVVKTHYEPTSNPKTTAEEREEPIYNTSIINKEMLTFFANKSKVRVEVSVEDATGNGDRALDFFMIEPNGKVENIPITLASILQKSDFLKKAISTLFVSGSEVLKISEAISEPAGRGSINGFIGITQKDVPLDS
jgi:hypothetical protein